MQALYTHAGTADQEEKTNEIARLMRDSFNHSGTAVTQEAVMSAARAVVQSGQVEVVTRKQAIEQGKIEQGHRPALGLLVNDANREYTDRALQLHG